MVAGHFVKKCKHGFISDQCRCPGPKEEQTVPCFSKRCETLESLKDPATWKQESDSMRGSVYLDDHTIIDGEVDVRDAKWVRVADARVRGDAGSLARTMSIPVDRVLRVEWDR